MTTQPTNLRSVSPDSRVAKRLHKNPKTMRRWDENPAMLALGWPKPIYLNGRRHRDDVAVDAFLEKAAGAFLK